jgi:hypothetical protein
MPHAVHPGLWLKVRTTHELAVDSSRGETIGIDVSRGPGQVGLARPVGWGGAGQVSKGWRMS